MSEYKRLVREHGLTPKMLSTLSLLERRGGWDSQRLHLSDAMSAVGLQRKGLARSYYESARRGRRAGQAWSITDRGRALAQELRAARVNDLKEAR